MKIRCVWEHNGSDSLLYAEDFIGAFTRGASAEAALRKMPAEIQSYQKWRGDFASGLFEPEIVQEKRSELTVSDADSDVLFDEERKALRRPIKKSNHTRWLDFLHPISSSFPA